MTDKRPHHGFHVFFRGTGFHITNELDEMMPAVEEFVWDHGVFETDEDPLYVFADYELVLSFQIAHTHREYVNEDGQAMIQEFRVANMFDGDGKHMRPLTMTRLREVEEGELGEV